MVTPGTVEQRSPSIRDASQSASPVRLQILGPLRLWHHRVVVDLGPPQQAYVLALLLARAGRPLTVETLIDLIWDGDAVPASALNVIHKYIGALRRLLEPGLPSRGASSYVQRHGDSYVFAAQPGELDLVDFRHLVTQARVGLTEPGGERAALDHYVYALALWRGPAGEGLVHGTAAASLFAGLDNEFFDACTAAAELAVRLRRPEQVLAPLRLAATLAPLHEPVFAGLISALGAAGKQAEALSVFQAIRKRLAEDLGIDPSPPLLAAHQQILRPVPIPPPTVGATGDDGGTRVPRLVGRATELAILRRGLREAAMGGSVLFVVEGEPGAGKTRLLREFAAEAQRRGAAVAWGRCQQGGGAPAMWLWTQIMRTVLDFFGAEERDTLLSTGLGPLVELRGGDLDEPLVADVGVQFRVFEQVVDVLGQAATRQPVVLMIDDLQWADVTSLQLMSHVAAHQPGGTLLVGAIRDRVPVPAPELAHAMAEVSRQPAHRRVTIDPLTLADVAEIVIDETGHVPEPGAARLIHARSGGNPFFARELARLFGEGGPVTEAAIASAGVPTTVRDVVSGRMATLPTETLGLLRIAALIGNAVDLDLLVRAAGIDPRTCLERLDQLVGLGLLEAAPGELSSLRFPHDLVRESVADGVRGPLGARLHLQLADAMGEDDEAGESKAEGLAFHLLSAGPLADPARTAGALIRSGRSAAIKSAFDTAERRLRTAVDVARAAGLAELELAALSQLTAVLGPQQGFIGPVFALMERAEHLARELGRERDAADFLFARFIGASQNLQTARGDELAHRLLDMGGTSADPVVRAHALHAWAWHRWETGEIGEALRIFSQSEEALPRAEERGRNALRRDIQLLRPGMHALVTGMYGDLDAARGRFDAIAALAGDDMQVTTLWVQFSLMMAGMAGDPGWALRVVERSAIDEEHPYVYLDHYIRLSWCWARALTGDNPSDAAAEAESILTRSLIDPPMSGLTFNCALVAETFLAAGQAADASRILDLADRTLKAYGQRYAEGLLLLLRARVLQSRDEPVTEIAALAEQARALSSEREAYLFTRRAESLLAELAA